MTVIVGLLVAIIVAPRNSIDRGNSTSTVEVCSVFAVEEKSLDDLLLLRF
jgi:hypothetical protein